jgi:hypothetical protein
MNPVLLILLFSCLFTGSAKAQEVRLKGMVIPLFEHSIAAEYAFRPNWSVQMAYQNQIELGDNIYFHHRLSPSVRYYHTTDRPLLDRIYGEFYHRSSFIRHIPDQSDDRLKKYQSQSIGFSLGKQIFFRSRNMFMEFSFGRYLIYNGNVEVDRPVFNVFIHRNESRTRVDFKLGFRLRSKKPGSEKRFHK